MLETHNPMKAEPNGTCWCGCGKPCGEGAWFRPGHDSHARARIERRYGSTANMVAIHGGPPVQEYNEDKAKGLVRIR